MPPRRFASLLVLLAVAPVAVRAADPPPPTTPAVQMMVTADLLSRALAGPLAVSSPVQSVSGTQFTTGTSHLSGSRRLELVPCDSMAVLRLTVDAASSGDLVVQRPRARVYASTAGTVTVAQDLFLSRDGLSAGVPAVSAPTSVYVGRVESDLPPVRALFARGVVRFAARRTTAEQNAQATAETESKVTAAVGDESARQLAAANAQFTSALAPLAEVGVAKDRLRFATTSSALCALVDQPAPFPATFPAFDSTASVRIAVHASFVNSQLEPRLAGKTFTRSDLTTPPKDGKGFNFLSPAPAKETPKTDEKDWSLTFAKKEPVTLSADKNELRVVIRLAELTTDEADIPAMNVTIAWAAEVRGGRPVLVRAKPPEVYPPGFVPGGGKRLTAREQAYRTVLNRRFDKLLPAEIEIEKVVRGVLPSVGGNALAPTQVMTAGDWLWVELR